MCSDLNLLPFGRLSEFSTIICCKIQWIHQINLSCLHFAELCAKLCGVVCITVWLKKTIKNIIHLRAIIIMYPTCNNVANLCMCVNTMRAAREETRFIIILQILPIGLAAISRIAGICYGYGIKITSNCLQLQIIILY